MESRSSSGGIHDSVIQKEAKTARFLQSKYLRNVQSQAKQLYKWSLNFKNIDLEYEWRLREIQSKKWSVIVVTIWIIHKQISYFVRGKNIKEAHPMQYFEWTTGLMALLLIYLMYFSAKTKKFKPIQDIIDDKHNELSKWEEVKVKL